MPRGANKKREREYEELKNKFRRNGRYGDRAEQVAARIVNKQRAQYGETKREKTEERKGTNPDRNLPLENYRHLTISALKGRLKSLSKAGLKKIERYEQQHKARKGALQAIRAQLDGL